MSNSVLFIIAVCFHFSCLFTFLGQQSAFLFQKSVVVYILLRFQLFVYTLFIKMSAIHSHCFQFSCVFTFSDQQSAFYLHLQFKIQLFVYISLRCQLFVYILLRFQLFVYITKYRLMSQYATANILHTILNLQFLSIKYKMTKAYFEFFCICESQITLNCRK